MMELLDRLLSVGFGADAGDAPYKPRAKKLRKQDRKRMQQGAKQYGKVYYVPQATKRRWIMYWFVSTLVISSLLVGATIVLMNLLLVEP